MGRRLCPVTDWDRRERGWTFILLEPPSSSSDALSCFREPSIDFPLILAGCWRKGRLLDVDIAICARCCENIG